MNFFLPLARATRLGRSASLSRHALLLSALVASPALLRAEDNQRAGDRRGGEDVQRGPDGRGPSLGDRGPRQSGPPFGGPGGSGSEGFRPGGRGPGGPEGRGPGGPRGSAFGPMAGRPGAGPEMMMRMMPVLAALDANRDGVISADEINNASGALKKLDRNGDGKLTAEELRPNLGQRGEAQGDRPAGPPARGPEGRGPEGRGPEGRGPEGRGPEGRGPEGRGPEGRGPEGRGPEGRGPQGRPDGQGRGEAMRKMFEARDQDGDGLLRGDEIPEQMASRLDRIDQNGDAAISREELQGMMNRFREAGQAGPRPGRAPGTGQGGAGRPDGRGPRPGGEVPRRPGSDR